MDYFKKTFEMKGGENILSYIVEGYGIICERQDNILFEEKFIYIPGYISDILKRNINDENGTTHDKAIRALGKYIYHKCSVSNKLNDELKITFTINFLKLLPATHDLIESDKICEELFDQITDENCKLFIHSVEIQCICDNCCCNEICCLYKGELEEKKDKDKLNQNFCEKRCSLPLGHINMCNIHNNKKCEKHRNKCKCGKINKKLDKHICEISPYNHGFICVSLDFEGLGTFERSLEQDLDLAMVGAALANSLILRADKTFDTFMQKRMMDWSEGSKKIKNFKNTHYFGGNIIFCQKDIPKNNEEEVKNMKQK